jgi:PAS domain S-box-containing protein
MMRAMPSVRREVDSVDVQVLVDSIPALIHTARPDGYLDYFNKPWLEYLGVTLDKVAGWNWTAFIHTEDLDGILTRWRACLITGEIFEYETRVRRANGEYRWMFHRKVPLRDAKGNIVRWYGSSLDIDARKLAEEQLRHNAEELRRSEFYLAEGQRLAHMGSWAFDPDGFYYWSPELFRMHGLDSASEPPDVQEYLDRVHPHDRESMANLINGILTKALPFDATKRIVRPDGEVRYIRCVGAPILENQSLKKYVGSAIDVTAHELLTQELRRREVYLTEAQRLSHTGSFGWNVSTDEHFWSDETFRIFELPPSSKISLPMILERVHPQDRLPAETAISAANRGEGIDLELRLLVPDGRIKYLHVVGKAERDITGSIEIIGAVMDVTPRKQIEVELRRSKAHLTAAQRLSRTGSVGMEVSTKRIFWSEESARIYGYGPETEPTPDLILRRVHPEDVGLLKNALERAAQGGNDRDFDFEHRLLMPDGSIKHIYNLSHCLMDEAGNEEVVGAIMDITERKLAEDAIRRSEAYLAEAQRLSHTGSFGWKPETGEIVWSAETYRIFEYDRSVKPTIDSVAQRVHPKDRSDFEQVIHRVLAGATDFEHAYPLLLPGGRVKHVLAIAHVLQDASGNREFVGAVTDITERKEAEEKIREQEAELRQLVDLVPQLIAVYGPNRERLYANRTALNYLGINLDEWRCKNFAASAHPEDSERLKSYADRALSSGAPDELELRLRKLDGSYRWFLARLNPLRDEQGQITRWYFTATDIEDRKQAEDTLLRENVALREEVDKTSMFEEIVGTSPALKGVLSRISKVAPSNSTVLITGETGTGKELVARAIHRRSDRVSRPFVGVSCAAIPRDLIASELFGHEKGAFTGATHQRPGRFELANGGTLFLDEVGELPVETQIALLRVLQEHEFERVGGTRRIHANVRVIAATNRDLQAAISSGSFRSDLFYRLNVFPIEIPSLRERRADIPLLVEYFIDHYARKAGKKIKRVNKKTLELLESYPWPGNIRELQNVIERSIILCETEIFSIDKSWLPQQPPSTAESKPQVELPRRLLVQEKNMIEAALKETRGRVSGPKGAAAKLGIPRSTLESKIRSLKINKNRFRPLPGT